MNDPFEFAGAARSANMNGGAPASNVMRDGSGNAMLMLYLEVRFLTQVFTDAIASFKAARGISKGSGFATSLC